MAKSSREGELKKNTMKMTTGTCKFKKLCNLASSDRGFTMVEVLVALALIGVTGVAFLSSLTTVSKSTITADRHSTTESLAVSQMEYILSQDYDDTGNPPQYDLLSDVPDGWAVNAFAKRLDPENDGEGDDDGIQEIIVRVNRGNKQVVTLISRKVDIAYVP